MVCRIRHIEYDDMLKHGMVYRIDIEYGASKIISILVHLAFSSAYILKNNQHYGPCL